MVVEVVEVAANKMDGLLHCHCCLTIRNILAGRRLRTHTDFYKLVYLYVWKPSFKKNLRSYIYFPVTLLSRWTAFCFVQGEREEGRKKKSINQMRTAFQKIL